METKKMFFMEKLVELVMTNLFQLAENVCNRFSLLEGEPVAVTQQETIPTIRFTNIVERKHTPKKVKIVEGELFNDSGGLTP